MKTFLTFLLLLALLYASAQNNGQKKTSPDLPFSDIHIKTDTQLFKFSKHHLDYEGTNYFFFQVDRPDPTLEVRFFPRNNNSIDNFSLIPSTDFSIIDSMVFVDNNHFRLKIKYVNLLQTAHPVFIFSMTDTRGETKNHELKLFPYFIPEIRQRNESIELFSGEEKTIEIGGKHVFNIATNNNWITGDLFDYHTGKSGDNLRIQVRPKRTGNHQLTVNLKTIKPFLNEGDSFVFDLEPLILSFNIKPSRLQFINTDKEFIFHEPGSMRAEEIQIDYHPDIQLQKTYRIENRNETGGQLIAELTPKSVVSNKIICDIRTYFLHRVTNGYLYIKDGNRTHFMTNFNIVYRPEIRKIEILREGQDWTTNLAVYPGENIEVKIEGSGLFNTHIEFDGCISRKDTVRLSDQVTFYSVAIPENIPRRKIVLFMNRAVTQHELLVREHQKPAPFDFISINYGANDIPITDELFNKPVLYAQTIRDINILFDNSMIDVQGEVSGKQYIHIEVRLLDDKNRLIDIQHINNIVVCPGSNSLRHAFYDASDCHAPIVNLNDFLLRKTYHLDAFSQIVITIKHNENRYSSIGQSRKITIMLERRSKFDIQVSFPAGLLVKEFKDAGIGNLSGISTSVLAEFSFYDKKQLGRLKPYRFGAGFIALNAFNFNENPNITRDIGIVVMTAIEPVNKNAKFSVPIYLGGGYLLKKSDFFAIFGPGIRFQF